MNSSSMKKATSMNESSFRIGIDLGGTKIELGAFQADGKELFRNRIPTPRGNYPATLSTLQNLVHEAEHALGSGATVGIGTPGSLSPLTGLIRNANSTCLNHQPLKSDLELVLGRNIRLANDANCFAVSEARDGAGAGANVVFGVILGTGVGAGIVVHSHLLTGTNAIAGEWGHNPLLAPGTPGLPPPLCYCGRLGCVETYLSGPGLSRDHQRETGESLPAEAIAQRAEEGIALCSATMDRYESRLARSLGTVINLLDPDVIVLGGGLSNIQRLYENVPRLWAPHIFSDVVRTRLMPNVHGDSSGVRGAAWLWE